MIIRHFLAALAALATSAALADKAVELTVAGYGSGRTTLEGLPILVRISPQSIDGFDYAEIAQDFSNLVFTDSAGRELPYDVDTWNTAGESLVWVRANTLAQGTTFSMRYGSGQSRTLAPTAVWSGYAGVWHFSETIASADAATTSSADATGGGHALAPFEGYGDGNEQIYPDLSMMTNVAGKVGQARLNSNWNVRRHGLKCADSTAFDAVASAFTFSGWYYANGANVRYCERLVSRMGRCWELTTGWDQANRLAVVVAGSETQYTIPSLNDGWVHLAVVFDGTDAAIYANGSLVGSHTTAGVPSSGGAFSVGLQPEMNDSAFSGSYDEIRYGGSARSADWIYASYQTQANPAFLSYGDAEAYTAVVAQVTPVVRKALDASESGLQQGRFTVSIGEALAWPLQVLYTVSGTAVAGTDYVALPGYVTIPAGETSADIVVTPLMNLASDATATLTVAIAEGSYLASNSLASLYIANFVPILCSFDLEVTGYPANRPDLADFPVLVRLSEDIPGFKYRRANADGSDLYFTDETDTVVYPSEVDTWDNSGESLVWVRLPVLRNGARFRGHFGGYADRSASWSDTWTGYVGVWHFGEDDGMAYDSTANGIDASPAATGAGDTSEMVAFANGAVGRARTNMSTARSYWGGQGSQYLYAPYHSALDMGQKFVVSGWWRASGFVVGGCSRPISHKDNWSGLGWEVTLQDENGNAEILYPRGAGGTTHNYGQIYNDIYQKWCHLVFVYDWAALSVYVNGALTLTSNIDNNDAYRYENIGLAFGCMANGADQSFIGQYDEIRLKAYDNTSVMGDWAWAEYNAVVDAGFVEVGEVTSIHVPGTIFTLK